MAYVGISRQLITDINSKLRELNHAEIAAVNAHHGETKKPELQSTDWLFRLWWADETLYRMHVAGQLPDRLYVKGERAVKIMLKELHPDPNGMSWYSPDMWAEVADIPRHVFVRKDGHHRDPGVYVSASQDPAFQKHLEHRQALSECNRRWTDITNQVTKFVAHAKSLNEALKLWPDLARYVPKSYLNRVEAKVEKTKAESKAKELLANMDFDTITSSTVIARMSGTN